MNDKKIIKIGCFALVLLFITVDFMRIAGFPIFYNYSIYIISTLSIIMLFIEFKNITKNKFNKTVLIFIVLFILVEYVNNEIANINVLCEHICWIILPMIFIRFNYGKKYIATVSIIFVLLNLCLAIPSILNHFVTLPVFTKPGPIGYDAGFYGNQNVSGMINAISLVLSIWLYKNIPDKVKILFIFTLIISFITLLFSGSRSGLLGIIVVVFMYFILKINSTLKRVLFIVIMSFGGLVTILFRKRNVIFAANGIEEFLRIVSTNRTPIWREALIMIKDKPFLGYGINNLNRITTQYFGDSGVIASYNGKLNHLHNIFINITFHSGIIVLLAFIFSCYTYIKKVIINFDYDNLFAINIVIVGFIISLLDVPLLYCTSAINIVWWLFVFYSYNYENN